MTEVTKMSHMKNVTKTFDEFIETFKKRYNENEIDNMLKERCKELDKSKTVSSDIKLIFKLIQRIESCHKADLASKIAILYNCTVMATVIDILDNSVKILENQFNILETQLVESKIFEKCKDIEDIKKLKATLKAQKEEREKLHREAQKLLEESRNKDLSYVS